jgi:hypothetical protein
MRPLNAAGPCRRRAFNSEALILATPLAKLTLNKSVVAGCQSVTGTLTLPGPAPAGGTTVPITDTLASATAPATVTVPAGATSARFVVKTAPLLARESGSVGVNIDGLVVSQTLHVRPTGLASLSLRPASVVGALPTVGTATLECPAGPGPVTVDLASSLPGVAGPVAASVVVPQGIRSAPFEVTTSAVLNRTKASIKGTANGLEKSRTLTVSPAASVSPTSLRLGGQPVGTTSSALEVTLSNNGALAASVEAVALTGTSADWFAQSNDCPATLPAGASCAISVAFTPLAVASKSARLTVTTSATDAPLAVSLSGSGT